MNLFASWLICFTSGAVLDTHENSLGRKYLDKGFELGLKEQYSIKIWDTDMLISNVKILFAVRFAHCFESGSHFSHAMAIVAF